MLLGAGTGFRRELLPEARRLEARHSIYVMGSHSIIIRTVDGHEETIQGIDQAQANGLLAHLERNGPSGILRLQCGDGEIVFFSRNVVAVKVIRPAQ